MTYPNVCLRRGEAADVRAGQTLIFENELDWADDTCTDGCIVDVLDEQLRFTARGFFNSRSKITVRVLTRDQQELITPDFFRARIESAWRNRRKFTSRIPAASSSAKPTAFPASPSINLPITSAFRSPASA